MIVRGLCVAALAAALSGCGGDSDDRPADRAATAPASAPEPAGDRVDLKLAPISTFENACARCHGPEGSFYGQQFAAETPGELREVVREMMVGPAYLDPSAAEVDAMTAYHRAIVAGEPFVCVVNAAAARAPSAPALRGEASAGADLSAADEAVLREQDGVGWRIEPAPRAAVLVARRGDARVELQYPLRQWTHGR